MRKGKGEGEIKKIHLLGELEKIVNRAVSHGR
jgi:hypothetical protein